MKKNIFRRILQEFRGRVVQKQKKSHRTHLHTVNKDLPSQETKIEKGGLHQQGGRDGEGELV